MLQGISLELGGKNSEAKLCAKWFELYWEGPLTTEIEVHLSRVYSLGRSVLAERLFYTTSGDPDNRCETFPQVACGGRGGRNSPPTALHHPPAAFPSSFPSLVPVNSLKSDGILLLNRRETTAGPGCAVDV